MNSVPTATRRVQSLCISLASLIVTAWPGIAGADADAGAHAGVDVVREHHECLIEPHTRAAIGSPSQGILEHLLVDRGDIVKAGQPLAELVSDVESATVEHARARAKMRSEIAAREADLELAVLDLARSVELHDQGLLQVQKRDEALAREQIATAAVVQARENHELQKLELLRSERLLAQRTLRAPFDGVVVEQHVFPGEFVYDNPVMTIAAIDRLSVEVVLPARLFGSVRVGDTAEVVAEMDEHHTLLADVEVVDRLLDAASGTFGVRLVLPNPERDIVGGQKCRIGFAEPLEFADGDGY